VNTVRRRIFSDFARDDGLSLIEVIVSIMVIIVVTLSAAGLSINGIASAASQERRAVAVTIANGAMETVAGWQIANSTYTTVSSLYTGRYQGTVQTAFTNNSTQPGVSQTYPGWDPSNGTTINPTQPAVTASTTPAIPITATSLQNGTTYTTTTLIGSCYEPTSGGACTLLTGQATPPATTPANYSQLFRVIVIVSWTAGKGCATGCSYEASSLEAPTVDLNWISHA
jgi:Tfp pilus assembly protein PilV